MLRKAFTFIMNCLPLVLIVLCVVLVLEVKDNLKSNSRQFSTDYMDKSDSSDASEASEPPEEEILHQSAEIKELDISAVENRENELVFNISLDDFIDSYNGYYWNDKSVRYLPPSYMWGSCAAENAVHSAHETLLYTFTEDEKLWSFPTISAYVPTNSDHIQEITLEFDNHGYTDALHEIYEEHCLYTLKVFFPELSNDKITELYSEINAYAFDHFPFPEMSYSSNSTPQILYYKDGTGVYPYFPNSVLHLCIIPVTDSTLDTFSANGTDIYEIV